jgi:hypothetical protein
MSASSLKEFYDLCALGLPCKMLAALFNAKYISPGLLCVKPLKIRVPRMES